MKVLVIAAHGDDAEFSMGGTIARFTRAGHTVKVIVAIIPFENKDGIAVFRFQAVNDFGKQFLDEQVAQINYKRRVLPPNGGQQSAKGIYQIPILSR